MDSKPPIIEIIVVGDSEVGKSCLLVQYCKSILMLTQNPPSVSGKKVRLQIWDTPGEKRFQIVMELLVRGASGCVIVSDIQDQNTLWETLKWKNKVEQENSGRIDGLCIPFMLVQNKCDTIIDGERQDFQQPQYLEKFTKQNGFLGSLQTSAKTNVGVEIMSSIEKLQINGFRSFCHVPNPLNNKEEERKKAQEQQEIKFQKPLTLIWGHNGAGKTTIIECLKLATTGQYPPNSDRGKTFLTDSQLLRQTETQSLLQLDFLSMNQQSLAVRRTFRVTSDEKGLSMSAVGSTLNYKHPETGEFKSLNQRCVEMDVKVPQLLGVTTPILTHVIFCHQEEQFWMFADNLTLKKIFDELFDTTRFAKMQQWLQDTTKAQAGEAKKLVEQLINAKRDVQDATRSRESTTKLLLELHAEGMRMKSQKDILDQLDLQCDPNELNRLARVLSERQHAVSVLSYKIESNVVSGVEITASEKQLRQEKESRCERTQEMLAQQQKLQSEMERQQRDVVNKKFELATLEESDNHEMNLKQELNQLRSQAHQLIPQSRQETDEALLKRMQAHQSNLDAQMLQITTVHNIDALTTRQSEVSQSLSESQGNIQFLQACSVNLLAQLQTTKQQLQPIKQHHDTVLDEHHTLKTELLNLNETLYEKQSLLTNLQREQNRLSMLISAQMPLHEYASLQKELEMQHSLCQNLDKEITSTGKQFKLEGFQRAKDAIQFKITQLNSELQEKQSKINELSVAVTVQEELISVLQRESLDASNYQQHKQELQQVSEQYDKAKQELIKFTYSSGEFIEQYVQGSTFQKKCIICYKPVDAADIQAIIDRKTKNINMIKLKTEQKQKNVADLRLKKSELKKHNLKFQQQQQNSQKIALSTALIEQLQQQKHTILTEHADLQAALTLLHQELKLYDHVYPLLAHKQLIQKSIDGLNVRLERLKPQQSGTQDTTHLQKELDSLQLEGDNLHKQLSQMTDRKSWIQGALKKIEVRVKQAELQDQQIQRHSLLLPQLEQDITRYEIELQECHLKLNQQKSVSATLTEQLTTTKAQLQQALQRRDEQLQEAQQNMTILRHIVPLFAKALERMQDMKKKKKMKQAVESQLVQLRSEVDKLEEGVAKIQEIQRRFTLTLQENEAVIANLESQLRSIAITQQNKLMEAERESLERSMKEEKQQMQSLESVRRERERSEIVLEAARQKLQEHFTRCKEQRRESELRFQNAEKTYLQLLFQEETYKALVEDLTRYQKEAESTLVQHHREKMEEINHSIQDTWKSIYEGEDIQRIFIKSDEDTSSSKKNSKSYHYRIVMESKSGVEMDMKGRCSMGQKVLASIVIRLALTESFGNHCGVLALDEPTTNLDKVHIQKLAQALGSLVELMLHYKQNLQMIIITHDKTFVKMMSKYAKTYVGITKMPNGFSKIETFPLEQS